MQYPEKKNKQTNAETVCNMYSLYNVHHKYMH